MNPYLGHNGGGNFGDNAGEPRLPCRTLILNIALLFNIVDNVGNLQRR